MREANDIDRWASGEEERFRGCTYILGSWLDLEVVTVDL